MTSPTQKDGQSFQLIDEKGVLNEKGLDNFITTTNLSMCGKDFAVIAIIGPQSSGKSTLVNHLGGTNFKVMNSCGGRHQTTRGVWISKCVSIHQPFTIAMDIEGTDGAQRGEDTAFEGKSALFALAVADILIVNLWSNGIGLQHAASIPLLERILQIRCMRIRLHRSVKTKLCFILRDITTVENPLEALEEQIKGTMEATWNKIATSKDFEGTNISDFFHVLVFGLPQYRLERKEFEYQVAELRGKLLSLDREERDLPAEAFKKEAQELWKSIKEERLLNLPAQSEMVAESMCKESANTWLEKLISSKNLTELEKKVKAGPAKNLGGELYSLMELVLSNYRSEVKHYKEQIVKEREKVLKSEILEILRPLYATMLGHVRNETFQEFKKWLTKLQENGETFDYAFLKSYDICKKRFEEQCKDVVEKLSAGWDWLGCKKELCNEIENYAKSKVTEEHQENIIRLTGKAQGMSVGTGAAIAAGMLLGAAITAGALAVPAIGAGALAVPAMGAGVSAVPAIGAGALAVPAVAAASAGLTAVEGIVLKKKQNTIQDAIAVEKERHQQRCNELFHGGQPSNSKCLQECKQSPEQEDEGL